MCGICGKVFFESEQSTDPVLIQNMMDTIRHRGPDDGGTYISGPVGFGHRRLSIIDIHTGKQPISNEDGTVWVIYNGEIYNYRELRSELLKKGHRFKTETDTEVIVHLYEQYGESFVSSLQGMFAFALWDDKNKILLLARDRTGVKPLYYYATNAFILFASEIKSILADTSVPREVDEGGIARFLTYYYMPGDETLFRNIRKLLPGHYLTLQKGKVKIQQYWDLEFPSSPKPWTWEDAVTQLKTLLKDTVVSHMISDVPVGFLLSGGVDSTALLSYAVESSNKDISTFTIGFEGESFADERPYARLAAERFGTKHYETTITAKDFLDFLPQYVWHMEEPVCEPPAVALYYVTRLARGHVKVLISGEGGDEAFAGYPNYRNLVWLERLKKVLGPAKPVASILFNTMGLFDQRFRKYAPLMTLPLENYYFSRTSGPFHFFNRHAGELYSEDFKSRLAKDPSTEPVHDYFMRVQGREALAKMLYVDTKTWLPDDLLIKADKMTMANSVELRVPLLDHKVLEFAASLPSSFKLRGFSTKHILKKTFSDKVPDQILYRKKTGFPVPYERWLSNNLREWTQGILCDPKTLERGYFNKNVVLRILKSSLKLPKEVFSLVTLELWHRMFIDRECQPKRN